MGMRVNTGSGIDPTMVEKLIEVEKMPIKNVEKRRDKTLDEQKLFGQLKTLVGDLNGSLNSLRNRTDFIKLKVESSHPDIIDGTVDQQALPGSYEVEVRSVAKTHKLLAEAFPDKNETPVGFGYMTIELDDGKTFDIDIDPDEATLEHVARKINEAEAGAKAIVINTKENLQYPGEDMFRLLVISEKSGKEAKVLVDPDTTFLEFKEQVTGRNLEMLFEDVEVFDEDNNLEALMPGLVLNVKRAEPGTKISINISYDVDKTFEQIAGFVEKYNKCNEFLEKQFQVDPQTNQAGALSKDNTIRTIRRSLQNALQHNSKVSKFHSLAELGIITDSKTGGLKMDETKVKQALSEDYLGVANLFVQTASGPGAGTIMSDAVRGLQNSQYGVISSKDREYKRSLTNYEDDIARKERLAGQKAEGIKRRFSALESLLGGLNAQGQYLQAKFGGG
jgi:flagellar hook-associated protein 2